MLYKRKLIDPVEIGSKGGLARAVSLSASELQESGRSAAKARWDAYLSASSGNASGQERREAKKAKAAEPRPQCPESATIQPKRPHSGNRTLQALAR
jgi:hypothetical protein